MGFALIYVTLVVGICFANGARFGWFLVLFCVLEAGKGEEGFRNAAARLLLNSKNAYTVLIYSSPPILHI